MPSGEGWEDVIVPQNNQSFHYKVVSLDNLGVIEII